MAEVTKKKIVNSFWGWDLIIDQNTPVVFKLSVNLRWIPTKCLLHIPIVGPKYSLFKEKLTLRGHWRISLLSADTKSCYIESLISYPGFQNMTLSFPKVNNIHSFICLFAAHSLLSINYVLGTVPGTGDTMALLLPCRKLRFSGEPAQ